MQPLTQMESFGNNKMPVHICVYGFFYYSKRIKKEEKGEFFEKNAQN